jgi:hypothetical protein
MIKRHQKRNRGAQPGNQNARKHGYYSKVLDSNQLSVLPEMAAASGLDNEVTVLRTKIFSIMKREPENFDLLLRALSLLERMVRSKNQPLSGRCIKGLFAFYRKYSPEDTKGFVFPN